MLGDGFDSVDFRETIAVRGAVVDEEERSSGLSASKKSIAAARADFFLTLIGSLLVWSFLEGSRVSLSFFSFGGSMEVAEGVGFGPFEGAGPVNEGSGLDDWETEVGFFVVLPDFFFFAVSPSDDSRVRFFPFFSPSSVPSGMGTRVRPSHLPPSSSSNLQFHMGRLALELVLICID